MDEPPLTIVCAAPRAYDAARLHPQSLMQRLAERHQVLWVEPPRIAVGPPGAAFSVATPHPDLHVGSLRYWHDRATFAALCARAEWAHGTADEQVLSFDGCDLAMLAWQAQQYLDTCVGQGACNGTWISVAASGRGGAGAQAVSGVATLYRSKRRHDRVEGVA